jgi:RimJ/RimL family protein N-acetyltransferase
MKVLETDRLVLRWLTAEDAPLILRLVNEPPWQMYIGNSGVKTLADAERYIMTGPVAMYGRLGFGLYLVELKEGLVPLGICGLIKRDALDDVDIGYAFLQEFWSRGYAMEAASAVMALGARVFHLTRIVAVSSPENQPSAKLLGKLGFQFERTVQLKPGASEVRLYAAALG